MVLQLTPNPYPPPTPNLRNRKIMSLDHKSKIISYLCASRHFHEKNTFLPYRLWLSFQLWICIHIQTRSVMTKDLVGICVVSSVFIAGFMVRGGLGVWQAHVGIHGPLFSIPAKIELGGPPSGVRGGAPKARVPRWKVGHLRAWFGNQWKWGDKRSKSIHIK